MPTKLLGLHHVTATVDGAQEDLDFYLSILGLRLVKKTVNFDNNQVYHFYYGTQRGLPGTIMTTFPYRGHGVRVGTKGIGQVTATAFAVPADSMGFWKARLSGAGLAYDEPSRIGESVISFDDPSLLRIELVGVDEDGREPWTTGEIGEAAAIRGFHSVTLSVADPGETISLLTEVLGFSVVGEEGFRIQLKADDNRTGGRLDVLHEPGREPGVNGLGTVHHVALAIASEEEQAELRGQLTELGFDVSPVRDRKYFRSIYFREHGRILIEVATVGPGFTVDEPVETLGRELKLPEWEEVNRPAIERGLAQVVY